MIYTSLLLLFSLFFSACSEEREAPLYEVKLTQTSLHGLTKDTPFTLQYITPLFPGFDIRVFQDVTANSKALYRVYYHDVEWFQIEPTKDKKKIKSIYILSDKVEHICRVGSEKRCEESRTLHYNYNSRGELESIELHFN